MAGVQNIDFGAWADKITSEQVDLVRKKIALQALQGVVYKSPVDTGRFRGNWLVGVEVIDLSTTSVPDPAGGLTVEKGTVKIEESVPMTAIWITNNLPYANRLENGWSKQAPAGMVAITVAEIETQFK